MDATAVAGLLERERELGRIDREFDRLSAGSGSCVTVEGPAGIGKTELLAAMQRGARARGFEVLRARGSEFEAEVAFGVARQLFEPLLRRASAAERRRLLDGVARVGARALGIEAGEPPADRFAAIHGLFWLCATRAERASLVVVVDDAQWVDDPSLAWLGYLARRVGDFALLLLVGFRSGDPGAERAELVALVDGASERLSLGPLSATAVGAMVREELDEDVDDEFSGTVSELSGGNPLFVRELLVAAREEELAARAESVLALRQIAPSAVGNSVLARLRRLGSEAVTLARAVAVLGAGTDVVLAARLTELDPSSAELTADRLAAAQILAPVRPLEFVHPLIAAAVQEDMAPGARRVAHRRAASIVAGLGGSLPRVASHLLASGPGGDGWVVERLHEGARQALDRGAPDVAASYLRRALEEPPAERERAALLLTLGTAEWRAGQPQAIAHLEQSLAAASEDRSTLVATCLALAPAYAESDRAELAVEVQKRALQALDDRQSELAWTVEAGIVIAGLVNERTAPIALRRAEELRRSLRKIGHPPVFLLVALAYHAARTNRAAEAEELATRALASEPYPPPLEISIFLIVTLTLVECYELLFGLCEDLIAAARRRGASKELAAISVFRASALSDRGALADAEADARWTLERSEGPHHMHAISELTRVLIERDALDEAAHELDQCADPLRSRSDEVIRFLIARGRLRVAQGRLEEALSDFVECGERCVPLGRARLSAVPWRAEAALVHAALGNTGEARTLASEQLGLARAFGRPRTLGMSLRACALIEGGEAGLRLLEEAATTLERSGSPLELARVLSDRGAALRRVGCRVEARTTLARALDLAHHCGARRIAASTRAQLALAGAKPRRDAITGRDSLTPAELRVARLAADGLTNRGIAQALFITTKTAKVHLSRVYRKLAITSRTQLADALGDYLDD